MATNKKWMNLIGSAVVAAMVLWACAQPTPVAIEKEVPAEKEVIKTVQTAYELRMNGKADEAKTLLEQIITENPDDAAAHYELARTEYHMGLGKPGEWNIEDMQHSIQQAIEHDPDNVIYAFFAGHIAYLQAYLSLQRDQPDAKEQVARACSVYESVLELKPDYHEAMLYLVEIYGVLPEDKGGDKSKAEQYAKQLEEMDEVLGAEARSMLISGEVDEVDYWQEVLKKHEGNADVLEGLGSAYLYQGKVEDGVKCFEEAVRVDPERNLLFLDLARYHIMATMGDETIKDTALPLAEEAIKRYLDSEPILPLKAYALELSAKVKFAWGDSKGADELREKAEAIDPYYSKGFGVPPLDLFVPPGEISHNHEYFSRPF